MATSLDLNRQAVTSSCMERGMKARLGRRENNAAQKISECLYLLKVWEQQLRPDPKKRRAKMGEKKKKKKKKKICGAQFNPHMAPVSLSRNSKASIRHLTLG